jgi:hypothetical protein
MTNQSHIQIDKQSLSNTSGNKTRFGGIGGVCGVGKPSLPFTQFFMKTLLSAIVTIENKLGIFLPRKILGN